MKKFAICLVLILTMATGASACSYGAAGYASAYSAGFQVYNNFQVVAPVQAYVNVAPLVTYTYQAPATVQQYSYSQPLLSITYGQPLQNVIQYQLPIAAPVQPYFSNYQSSVCPNCAQSLYR